ncbi:MAG TPA: 2-dehydropantoate 2-reductase N-terminal domain-containing protein [Terriglobales bacterium]|nr:2-dehydropantoate 2-reductase N-terminal domain-containing protein [Terriglobales bacterium]
MKPDGRILVIGAGVNGSVCAAALHRAGYDVTVLAREKRLEELQKRGIEIEDPLKGTRTVTQVPVVDRLASEDIYEYVLVVVRKNQVRDLLPFLAQNQSQSVVFMVNTASGLDEWIAALGARRVMLGFVFAGGRREGNLIRAMRARGHGTPFGEANGAITERLTRLVSILNRAGLKAKAIADMPDWLVTHAAMVAPLAMFLLKHGCDTYALARSREDMGMLADAMRETLAVLRANGRRIVPQSAVLLDVLPRFVVTSFFRAFMSSRYAEIGAGWHCSQAPDEMFQLARELKDLVEQSCLPAPVLRQLLATV